MVTHVLLGRPPGGETLFEAGAHLTPVELAQAGDGLDCLCLPVDDETGHTVIDDLGYRTGPEGDDRRAASHRLDHHEAERLGPVDWKQQGRGAGEKSSLGFVGDFADQPNLGTIDLGLDLFLEVASFATGYLCG